MEITWNILLPTRGTLTLLSSQFWIQWINALPVTQTPGVTSVQPFIAAPLKTTHLL